MAWQKSRRLPWETTSPGKKSWRVMAAAMCMVPWWAWRQISANPTFLTIEDIFGGFEGCYWTLNPKSKLRSPWPPPLHFLASTSCFLSLISTSHLSGTPVTTDGLFLVTPLPTKTTTSNGLTNTTATKQQHTSKVGLEVTSSFFFIYCVFFLFLFLLFLFQLSTSFPIFCSGSAPFYSFLFYSNPPIFPYSQILF